MRLLLAVLWGVTAAWLPAQDPQFVWHDDLDAARALADEQGKPLLVMFRCEP